jgi:starvation-inducible DNA-binding protein
MKLDNLQMVLEETFSNNFVAYYRSHVAHVNITGPEFPAYHKMLQKVYEYFQDNIDTLAEKLRSCRGMMPNSVHTVLDIAMLEDKETAGTAEELLATVLDSFEVMIDQYHELYTAAEEVNYIDISNFAQDQIAILAKMRWMIEATLDI